MRYPHAWATASLGELTATTRPICYGVLKPGPYEAAGPPLLRIQDLVGDRVAGDGFHRVSPELDEEFARSRLNGGELLLSIQGTIGRTAVVPHELAGSNISRTLAVVDPAPVIEKRLLYYFFQHARSRGLFEVGGSTRASLNIGVLRRLTVPLPPLAEQRRIVAAIDEQFSRLDAAESTLGQSARRLVILRRSVFESNLAGLPRRALGDVAIVAGGHTPRGLASTKDGLIPFYKVGDMNSADRFGRMGPARTYLSAESAEAYRARLWPSGTLVFPKQGGAIATNKKRVLTQTAACDLNTMGVIPSEELDPRFLQALFGTIDLEDLSDGSVVAQIRPSRVARLSVPLPPLDDQRRIVGKIEMQLSLVDSLRLAVESAEKRSAALRRAILERAFRGELVSQDPTDEAASLLLERIRSERAVAPKPTRRKPVSA